MPPRPDPLTPLPPREAAFDTDRGAWVLSRYADVAAAFREPALWPVAARQQSNLKIPDTRAQQLLRTQVLDAFSSSALKDWQARMDRLKETVPSSRPLDLVGEFAEPWCLGAAEIVTGSAPADRHRLLAAARVVSTAAAEPLDEQLGREASVANAELERYFSGAAIPMAGPVFIALSRTVACLLASGWLALLRHPAELRHLRATPEQIPKAIDEILRYAGLPQSVFRYALRSVSLCGLQIEEGDRVILELASANRDPVQFSNPDQIDFTRREAAQLSLGFGPHSCVGAALIRMTAAAATRAFVERFADAGVCSPVQWQGGKGFRSPATLRVS
jgi:cytochrome P450